MREPECQSVYGLRICVGDYVEIYPRSRSLAMFRGFVKNITMSSIILYNSENDVAIRISEIKIIRKIKPLSR